MGDVPFSPSEALLCGRDGDRYGDAAVPFTPSETRQLREVSVELCIDADLRQLADIEERVRLSADALRRELDGEQRETLGEAAATVASKLKSEVSERVPAPLKGCDPPVP